MKLFRTGKQVTQVVKNMGRLRTILGVFVGHGLEQFVARAGLIRYLPGADRRARARDVEHLTVPERLRMAFESLGPTFVKLGQLLSNRPDMIPEAFIEEFKKLQDNVAPLPSDMIRTQVERELGGKIEDFFASFSEAPLASASIAQVHAAVLPTGEEVVVKVQRPDAERIVRTDISILRFLAEMMERYLPETRVINPVQVVEEFFAVLMYEVDFIVEAHTTIKVAQNMQAFPRIVIPKVYRELTTRRVLTLERLVGTRITDVEELRRQGIDPKELVDIGARGFFKMSLQDGLFHGDLHGGNLFALRDATTGESKVGVIDFGIVGRLSQKSRDSFTRMLFALVMEDYETLCFEYAELGATDQSIDFEAFQREVRNAISPYIGMSLKDIRIGAVLIDSTRIAVKYHIRLPAEWMTMFKAIFTLEGLGRQLDPDFDMLGIGTDLVKELLKERYSMQRFSRDFTFIARDLSALLHTMPRQLRMMFRKFSGNDFALEVKFREVELVRRQMERGFRGLGLALLSGSLLVAGAIALQHPTSHKLWGEYPVVSVVFLLLGLSGFAGLYFRSWK